MNYTADMTPEQNNRSYLHTFLDKGEIYALCRKCYTHQGIELFEPDTNDIPSWYIESRETKWFEKFKIYQPICVKLLKTTHDELANIWNVNIRTIEKALNKGRLIIDSRGEWYINSYPWEPQSLCYSCRNPEFPKYGDEDSTDGYLRLLKEQEAALWK